MPGWHSGQSADSVVCRLMLCRFAPNQGRTSLCCLYVAVCSSQLRCVTRSTHVCIIHGGVICLNSVPYRCYTYVQIIAIGSIGQLSDCSCIPLQCMLAHVHSLCHKPVICRYQFGMQPKRTLSFNFNGIYIDRKEACS